MIQCTFIFQIINTFRLSAKWKQSGKMTPQLITELSKMALKSLSKEDLREIHANMPINESEEFIKEKKIK